MKCRMFALSLALGALLCLAPSAAALEPQPEVPAPDAAEPAGQALTEEVTKEVTVPVEVAILPEEPPTMISYTTPEEINFEVPEASEPEAILPQTGRLTGRLLLPVGFGLLVGGRWLVHKAPFWVLRR